MPHTTWSTLQTFCWQSIGVLVTMPVPVQKCITEACNNGTDTVLHKKCKFTSYKPMQHAAGKNEQTQVAQIELAAQAARISMTVCL